MNLNNKLNIEPIFVNNNTLELELTKTQEELKILKELLSKPFYEIAQQNIEFKLNYDKEQEILADWMVSQKSFKELAIKYGSQLNKNISDIKKEGFELEIDVLENKNNPIHQTNSNRFIQQYGENLKNKISNKIINFQSYFDNLIKEGQIYKIGDKKPSRWTDVFDEWIELTKSNNKEAQFNLGYCFQFGYGTDQVLEHAAYFYHEALKQGETKSSFNLFLLYNNKDFINYNSTKALEYLNYSLEIQEPLAVQYSKDKNIINQEHTQIHNNLIINEQDLFDSLQNIIIDGNKPIEILHQLKQTNFKWAKTIEAFHNCSFSISLDKIKNKGSFFKPKKVTDIYLRVTNNNTRTLNFYISNIEQNLFDSNLEEIKPNEIKNIKIAFEIPIGSTIPEFYIGLPIPTPKNLKLIFNKPFIVK